MKTSFYNHYFTIFADLQGHWQPGEWRRRLPHPGLACHLVVWVGAERPHRAHVVLPERVSALATKQGAI